MRLAALIAVWGLAGCPATTSESAGGTGARAPGASPRRAAALPAGLTHEKGVPILTLRGTAAHRGQLQGRLLAAQIRLMVRGYLRPLVKLALGGWPKALAAAKKMAPLIRAEDKQEMRAMARAAGVTYEEILVLNTHIEVMLTARLPTLGCSAVGVQKTASGGPVYLARNVDFPGLPAFYKHSLLVVVHPPKGVAYAYYGVPGFLSPMTVVNAHGVAASANGGNPRKGRLRCVPLGLQLRAVLPSVSSADDLVSRLEKSRHCAGFIVTTADPQSGAQVLELSAEGAARRPPQGGLALSTNHFRTQTLRVLPANLKSSSHRRLKHLSQVLNGVRITPKKLMGVLHAKEVFQSASVQTIQTVIVDVTTMKLWVWHRGTPLGSFTTIDLKSRL